MNNQARFRYVSAERDDGADGAIPAEHVGEAVELEPVLKRDRDPAWSKTIMDESQGIWGLRAFDSDEGRVNRILDFGG